MFNYANSLATAERLLAKFGQDITITTVTVGAYDTATQTTLTTETPYTAKGVLLDYKRIDSGAMTAGNIQVNDKKLLVSPVGLTIEPNANDRATINGELWNVINVKTVKPASITVLYELQIRKS